jgi:uncharacterized membrane protein
LQTAGGRSSKSKVLAYLFQHSETEVMNIVRSTLKDFNCEVLANIHDAIVVRNKLSIDVRDEIHHRMRNSTSNPYWFLSPNEVNGYNPKVLNLDMEKELHLKRIAAEEQLAAMYIANE